MFIFVVFLQQSGKHALGFVGFFLFYTNGIYEYFCRHFDIESSINSCNFQYNETWHQLEILNHPHNFCYEDGTHGILLLYYFSTDLNGTHWILVLNYFWTDLNGTHWISLLNYFWTDLVELTEFCYWTTIELSRYWTLLFTEFCWIFCWKK